MCSIAGIFSNSISILQYYEDNFHNIEATIHNRGPDYIGHSKGTNYHLTHRLLSINGFTVQPFENDTTILLYNGEIYNWNECSNEYDSDGLLLFEMLSNNISNLHELDGEYAICLYDKSQSLVYLITDPFATKPLYYDLCASNYLAVGSYESTVNAITKGASAIQVPPNTVICVDLNDYTKKYEKNYHTWDFEPRHKTFDLWNEAFTNAIKKRIFSSNNKYFIGLSSGYDSGLIVAELLNQGKSFTAYTIRGNEDTATLKRRRKILRKNNINVEFLKPKIEHIVVIEEEIKSRVDSFKYYNVDGTFNNEMSDDKATIGLALICEKAHTSGHRIYISGQGADEIIADYGYNGSPLYTDKQSTIAGDFRNVRDKWVNFDSGFQRNYLGKEERISGHWSIEGRYPFLDKDVVQQYLCIDDELRSTRYKSAIANRLEEYAFPVSEGKIGFNPRKDIRHARRRSKQYWLKKISGLINKS